MNAFSQSGVVENGGGLVALRRQILLLLPATNADKTEDESRHESTRTLALNFRRDKKKFESQAHTLMIYSTSSIFKLKWKFYGTVCLPNFTSNLCNFISVVLAKT